MDEVRDPRRGLKVSRAPEDWPEQAGSRGLSRSGARPGKASEPIEQRLERWVSRGRDLVDGVSGARPGTRAAGPPAEGRPGQPSRTSAGGGFDPGRLGRWVEDRLDWLLDDGEEDWREPWQEAPRASRGGPWEAEVVGRSQQRPPAADPELPPQRPAAVAAVPQAAPPVAPASPLPRRDPTSGSASGRPGLEAISRRPPIRSGADPSAAATPARPLQTPQAAAPIGEDDWPDEASFSLNRWQRPRPQRPQDPLQPSGPFGPSEGGRRPLPRSTRRR